MSLCQLQRSLDRWSRAIACGEPREHSKPEAEEDKDEDGRHSDADRESWGTRDTALLDDVARKRSRKRGGQEHCEHSPDLGVTLKDRGRIPAARRQLTHSHLGLTEWHGTV